MASLSKREFEPPFYCTDEDKVLLSGQSLEGDGVALRLALWASFFGWDIITHTDGKSNFYMSINLTLPLLPCGQA